MREGRCRWLGGRPLGPAANFVTRADQSKQSTTAAATAAAQAVDPSADAPMIHRPSWIEERRKSFFFLLHRLGKLRENEIIRKPRQKRKRCNGPHRGYVATSAL